jgi:hypothetical protein
MSVTRIRQKPSPTNSVQTCTAYFLLKTSTQRPGRLGNRGSIPEGGGARDSSLQFDRVTESIMKTSLVAYDAVLIGNLLQTSRWRFLPLQGNKEEVFCLFVCFHGRQWQVTDVPKPSGLFVPPALDVLTLATRFPLVYRRVPHSSGGSSNLWAENNDR